VNILSVQQTMHNNAIVPCIHDCQSLTRWRGWHLLQLYCRLAAAAIAVIIAVVLNYDCVWSVVVRASVCCITAYCGCSWSS
jgi:hypothetical protein